MTAAPLTCTINGADISSAAVELFSDATDTLSEQVTFHSISPSSEDPAADWDTYFSVHYGQREKSVGNWELFFWPIYGGPNDDHPYYTRVTIPVILPDGTTVNIDSVSSAEVIGHSQTIPPTVVQWNSAGSFVSSVEGHTLAFTENSRIYEFPDHTGFDANGEFVIRYDHSIEAEDRETFYVAASWPDYFVASNGEFLRGDIPDTGSIFGFTHAERGPYIHRDDQGQSTNYPIDHIESEADKDKDEWDNAWKKYGSPARYDSGIGPLCLNILSRGSSHLRDFGYAWLIKGLAARTLTALPSPEQITTRAEFTYNYDEGQMRTKGRPIWAMVFLWRVLTAMEDVRTSADSEFSDLRDALALRAAHILDMLKLDFDNNSYIETRDGGIHIPYWQLGHYWQGMLVYQEAVFALLGALDTKVHEMMVQFADDIFTETVEWTNNGPHPRDATVTYTGGFNGWALENDKFLVDPGGSHAISFTGVFIAVYEWSLVNGLNQGSKLTAIIAQYDDYHYTWHLAGPAPLIYGSVTLDSSWGLATGTPLINYNASVDVSSTWGIRATPTIAGGGKTRTGTVITATSTSIGDPIAIDSGGSF